MAHTIVLGNEKGGSGKSTTAMHLVIGLLHAGYGVGAIDLDGRQRTLSRYLENRQSYMERMGVTLPMPDWVSIKPSEDQDRAVAEAEDSASFDECHARFAARHPFVVVDCPGSHTHLAALGHSYADTLITPMNDSFIDLDLLAEVNPRDVALSRLSHYSEMVFEQRKRRLLRSGITVDWVVMRNRLSNLDAKNKRRVGRVLDKLAKRIGFRLVPGFGERVIYREMFLSGLTLSDLAEPEAGISMTMSHVAARSEVRTLLRGLKLPVSATAFDGLPGGQPKTRDEDRTRARPEPGREQRGAA